MNWPPKEFSKTALHDERYNTLYYMNDPKGNFRMFRWIDNNIVKMVSNIHMGSKDEVIMKPRKKPRINEFNRKHIRLVWGDDHVVSIKIPTLINDYNMWMLGVDLVDQLIAYYRPKIRCRRTWMPLLLHCLDIIRVNSYVLYKETSYLHPAVNDDEIDSHKQFLIEFTNSLIRRAKLEDRTAPVTRQATPVGTVEPVIHLDRTSQLHFSRTKPSLKTFDHVRFLDGDHTLIPHTQRVCKYCQYLAAVARVKKEPLPVANRARKECRICKVNLCDNHKDLFHAR